MAVPANAASRSHQQTSSREELLDRLDALYATYLQRLEEYQTARKQLSDALAAGFFSLAQANFSNPSRTRFGQDYYDERMQAIRTVRVESAAESWRFEVTTRATSTEEADAEVSATSPGDEQEETKLRQRSGDPLRWFGILVPPPLRESQFRFSRAVEGPIPLLASISRELRDLETQMNRLKKEIKKTG